MKITDKDVRYVADLANLELTEGESTRMLRDLNSILEYVDSFASLFSTTRRSRTRPIPTIISFRSRK